MYPIRKSILVEVPLDSSTQQLFKIPNQPFLEGKKVYAICAASTLVTPETLRNNLFISQQWATADNSCFLTLMDGEFAFIDKLPVVELFNTTMWTIDSTTPASPPFDNKVSLVSNVPLFEIVPRVISWSKSYFYFPAPFAYSGYSLLLQVFYQD